MAEFQALLDACGPWGPAVAVMLFLLANFLVIWRLEVLSAKGVEGTVLGTIFMPFCSGMGNIVFALVMGLRGGSGEDVLVNCLFNNITNLTLLIGLPALIWHLSRVPRKSKKKANKAAERNLRMSRLSLSLNLVAAIFFTLVTWLLCQDGELNAADGFVFLAFFAFWQSFHVYDVKKTNLLQKKSYPRGLGLELLVLVACGAGIVLSTDWLVQWFPEQELVPLSRNLLGWISGVLMVLPNALLAFYYGSRNRMDVVVASQTGDAHICIPLCVGVYCVLKPIPFSPFLEKGLLILMGLSLAHLLCVMLFGRLPRPVAALLVAAFGWFMWQGLG